MLGEFEKRSSWAASLARHLLRGGGAVAVDDAGNISSAPAAPPQPILGPGLRAAAKARFESPWRRCARWALTHLLLQFQPAATCPALPAPAGRIST